MAEAEERLESGGDEEEQRFPGVQKEAEELHCSFVLTLTHQLQAETD